MLENDPPAPRQIWLFVWKVQQGSRCAGGSWGGGLETVAFAQVCPNARVSRFGAAKAKRGVAQFVNVNYLYLFGSLFQNAYGAKGKAKAP